MVLRAFLAVLLLPGIVGGLVPAAIVALDPWRGKGHEAGLVPIAAGIVLLLFCVRSFLISGRGTLAPWDPPRRLVVTGHYRYMRNPMYVGVVTWVLGTALYAGSWLCAAWGGLVAIVFHLRVKVYEEPRLARQFPEDWAAYSAAVPRWRPRMTPWEPGGSS